MYLSKCVHIPVGPLLGDSLHLGVSWHVSGDEEPEQTLGKGLGTSGGLWQHLLALRDGQAPEPNSLIGVQN